jgi:hypothetical protein
MQSRLSGSLSARACTASKLHVLAYPEPHQEARLPRAVSVRKYATGTVRCRGSSVSAQLALVQDRSVARNLGQYEHRAAWLLAGLRFLEFLLS